jgi:hypothetical protein
VRSLEGNRFLAAVASFGCLLDHQLRLPQGPPRSSLSSKRWSFFDDTEVRPARENEVCSPAAYVLFYTSFDMHRLALSAAI